jgi:hypothetical protein
MQSVLSLRNVFDETIMRVDSIACGYERSFFVTQILTICYQFQGY